MVERSLLFTTEEGIATKFKVMALVMDGVIMCTVQHKFVAQLISREMDGNFEIKVEDPDLLDAPVTLILERDDENPEELVYMGEEANQSNFDGVDCTGESIPASRLMINKAAALINMIMHAN
jgi:hypothetical protein